MSNLTSENQLLQNLERQTSGLKFLSETKQGKFPPLCEKVIYIIPTTNIYVQIQKHIN